MSTMQMELQRVMANKLNKPNGFQPTNNVSRATFNYVRDNPGCTRAQATDALAVKGYKLTSTASLLSALTKQRQLRVLDDGKMYANLTEYAPLKVTSSKKSKKAKKVKEASVAPQAAPAAIEAQVQSSTPDDMDKYIDTLNVRQARVLMEKLKAIFGEAV